MYTHSFRKRSVAVALALMLLLSLFGGSVVFAAGPKSSDFVPAPALLEGEDYLITTEIDGTRYALSFDGEKLGAAAVTSADGVITLSDNQAVWTPGEGSTLESVGSPGTFIFSGSGGFMTFSGGRTFVYDADSSTVLMHNMYFLTFDPETKAFGQSVDSAQAAVIELYARVPLYTRADAFTEDDQFVITTEAGGQTMALSFKDGALTSEAVTPDGDTVKAPLSAVWFAREGNTVENAGSPGTFIFSGSAGFMTFSGGRTFVYQADKQAVFMHNMYYLTYDAATGLFGESIKEEDACAVTIYGREMPKTAKEEKYIPDGSDLPAVTRAAVKNADGSITLAFVSDIHYSTDYAQNNLKVWYENVAPQVGYIDALGSCGDMGSAYSATPEIFWTNVQGIFDYMDPVVAGGNIGNAIYTFGNHEWYPAAGGNYMVNYELPTAQRLKRVGEGLVTEDYIIYCFGAGAIAAQYGQGYSEEDIARIDAYLSSAPTDIPIFVLTHFPIHFWGDRLAGNAAKLLDVLNKYPNIVVLWGHNHSDFDENYDKVCRPGDTILIDNKGTERTLNFTYLSAGCISDFEYTGPDGGSAWVQGKGLITTINTDGTLTFDYYDLEGDKMEESGSYLVEFRENVYYETIGRQYVKEGEAAIAPEPPVIDQFTFTGWDTAFDKITNHLVVTAQYDFTPAKDAGSVYLTLTDGGQAVIGKSGQPILFYSIPCTQGMTVADAFAALQEAEYDGDTALAASTYGYFTDYWGKTGATLFACTVDAASGYASAGDALVGGNCYYLTLDENTASYLAPAEAEAMEGDSLTFAARTWQYQPSRTFMDVRMDGDVYIGKDLNSMADTGVDAVDGIFTLTMDSPGTCYVAVKADGASTAYAVVKVAEKIEDPSTEKTPAEMVEDLIAAIGTVTEGSGARIGEARRAYNALSDAEKAQVRNLALLEAAEQAYADLIAKPGDEPGDKPEEKPDEAPTYKMLEGAGAKYVKGSKKALTFRADAPFADFLGLKIDGKTVDKKYYKAWEGSTYVEIPAEALDTLSEGKHQVTLLFADGKEVSADFTVAAASSAPATKPDTKVPSTGDRNLVPLLLGLLAFSGLGLAAVTISTRKKTNHK